MGNCLNQADTIQTLGCLQGGDLNQREISDIYTSTQELILREEYQIGGTHVYQCEPRSFLPFLSCLAMQSCLSTSGFK